MDGKLKIASSGGIIIYESWVQNGLTGCYKVPVDILVVSNTNLTVSSSTINDLPVDKYSGDLSVENWGKNYLFRLIRI
ncbi:hypothetical protein ACM46_00780 [Chryseobacterium angstadtii]|uniref:Uncharacterized protein n=1 Tax=Chryseobacterium angstadtii TaxID=558151 RepID=A0A0J7IJ70_9FLAO|nr:hypothetical protein [Chryseobacterium angstadtii]KMQ66132.1 hypothetical protein ACM46_00780 [Chryseobacterium angstadtii]